MVRARRIVVRLVSKRRLGGGSVGVMGAIAKAVLDNGGKATGVVPEPLFKNGSKQLAETIIVPDMHTRKKTMSDKVRVIRICI